MTHAMLLAGALPLFFGAWLSDWAYGSTYQVQWANFAAWLLTGALVLAGIALIFPVLALLRSKRRDLRAALPLLLLLATWTLGFIDALVHAKDGWAMMPEGLILSVVTTLLAGASIWTSLAGANR